MVYTVVANTTPDRPRPVINRCYTDPLQAQYNAATLLVSGYTVRMTNPSGIIIKVYNNLVSVMEDFPSVTKYSYQANPPEVPWPLTPDGFSQWIANQCQSAATWPPPETLKADPMPRVIPPPAPPPPPTTGVLQIRSGIGNFCGVEDTRVEPHPQHKSLSRSKTYCQQCVQIHTRSWNEMNRGYQRELAKQSRRHTSLPSTLPVFHPLWESDDGP